MRTLSVLQGDGSTVTLQPGLIGGEVNRILAAHAAKHKCAVQYKIGPDPASIDSCMIGGIVANNASGMCCGVKQVRVPWRAVACLLVGGQQWAGQLLGGVPVYGLDILLDVCQIRWASS